MWQEVTASSIKAIRKKILPKCANDFTGFDNSLISVIDGITDIGRDLGFEKIDAGNIRELLQLHRKVLSN